MTEHPGWIPPRIGSQERGPRDRIIVNCAVCLEYRRRQRSTINHVNVHCPDAWKLWYDELPDGCPTHLQWMYGFKLAALAEAIDTAGFRYPMWMDTSFQPIASIERVWGHIETHGWYIPRQYCSVLGTWASDIALNKYGITRDTAMEIPLVFSGIVGLDMRTDIGLAIWREWKEYRDSFNGPHYNEPGLHEWRKSGYKWYGHCSDDPRCEGHRHDEAALSFVLWKLGLTPDSAGFLTIDNPAGVIGHRVPDYDIVAMREAVIEHIAGIESCGDYDTSDLEALCR